MLYKKGNVFDPKNYRPINLLNSIYKILQKCIKNHIENLILKKLSLNQFAYIKNRPIEDILIIFRHILELNKCHRRKVSKLNA